MAEILTCPTQEQLHALLEGRLPTDEQPRVTEHIEQCASCQAILESIRLSGESWADVAPGLVESAAESPMLQQALDRAKAGGASATTDGEHADPAEAWSFLQPSDNPDHLGRLDSYQILALIGKGGMGIVFRGFDEKLHRMVAIKVMAPQLATSGVARKRFTREARAAAAVSHDHVVPIYAVADEGPLPYLVMQLVAGQSLQEKLDRVGPLGLREILRIGLQTAEGLAAAHKQGLVHRDIKPANILLENGVERVKITDFGLARTRDEASVTQSGVIAGTPQFMAPEQAAGEAVDHRADLFSLGSVLYAMCAGRAPFRASNAMAVLKRVCDEAPTPIRQINPDIPDWLADIIAGLQQKKPSERFQSAQEVAELLGQHLAELQQPGPARWAARPESSKGVPEPAGLSTPFADSGRAAQIRKWHVDDRVFAPWEEEEWLYPGRVREVSGDSVYVWFDDGEVAWVKADDLRPLDIAAGSRVLAAWDKGFIYYPGTVTERDGDRVHLVYDDNEKEWTQMQYLCVPSGKPGPGARRQRSAAWDDAKLLRVGLLVLALAFAVGFVFTRGAAGPDGSTTHIGAFDPWLVYNSGAEGASYHFNAVSWSFASGIIAALLFVLWRGLRPTKHSPSDEANSALARLRNASIGLFITGILYWATIPILFAARISGMMRPEDVPFLWWTLGVFPAIGGFVLIFGAWKMRHGEMYSACLLAAILPLGMLLEKLINFRDGRLAVSPGDVTALPFGMWALIVLTRRDVRAAFAEGSAPPRAGSPVGTPADGRGAGQGAMPPETAPRQEAVPQRVNADLASQGGWRRPVWPIVLAGVVLLAVISALLALKATSGGLYEHLPVTLLLTLGVLSIYGFVVIWWVQPQSHPHAGASARMGYAWPVLVFFAGLFLLGILLFEVLIQWRNDRLPAWWDQTQRAWLAAGVVYAVLATWAFGFRRRVMAPQTHPLRHTLGTGLGVALLLTVLALAQLDLMQWLDGPVAEGFGTIAYFAAVIHLLLFGGGTLLARAVRGQSGWSLVAPSRSGWALLTLFALATGIYGGWVRRPLDAIERLQSHFAVAEQPRSDTKAVQAGEVVLKRIDPKEKPASTSGFFQNEKSEGQWAISPDSSDARSGSPGRHRTSRRARSAAFPGGSN